MWYSLQTSVKADPDFASSAGELLQTTLRRLVLITVGLWWVWQFAAEFIRPSGLDARLAPSTLSITAVAVLTVWILRRSFFATQIVWQAGLAAAVALAVHFTGLPETAFLFALLPLMAVVTAGWPAALLAECLVIALVSFFSLDSAVGLPVPYAVSVAIGGIFTGLLGWVATRALLTTTQWSLFSYERARQETEKLREQSLELKQIEEDLKQANLQLARLSDRLQGMRRAAEEARQTKEQFVANVSHELRTPLNMIIGFSEMIMQAPHVYGESLPPALLSDIAAIQRNSQHLAKLVDDVLDLSRIDADRMALVREWASLPQIVEDAVLAVGALFETKGLLLQTDVPARFPSLFCDAVRVRQVLINLLTNAGRFTERGGVHLKVWEEHGNALVSVADTGPGIAPQDQERIFEPFQQLDASTSRRHGGSGLGLGISKRLVEMHGGEMWLESRPGVGTTFYLGLPLRELSADLPTVAGVKQWFNPYRQYEARARPLRAPAPIVKTRYVILDQGDGLHRLFSHYVTGAEIIVVRDMDQARRELARSPAQALVVNQASFDRAVSPTDLTNLPYSTPAFTCWVPGARDAARRLGVVRYLVKPVSVETLLATLAAFGESVKTVLLVDDEPEILQLFTRMLSSAAYQYRVLQAADGQRALSLLRGRQPDLMLLDLLMPGMDGFQVLREKGEDPSIREIPVVVVSANDADGQVVVSNSLTVMRGGGLSARDLLECVQGVSAALSLEGPGAGE